MSLSFLSGSSGSTRKALENSIDNVDRDCHDVFGSLNICSNGDLDTSCEDPLCVATWRNVEKLIARFKTPKPLNNLRRQYQIEYGYPLWPSEAKCKDVDDMVSVLSSLPVRQFVKNRYTDEYHPVKRDTPMIELVYIDGQQCIKPLKPLLVKVASEENKYFEKISSEVCTQVKDPVIPTSCMGYAEDLPPQSFPATKCKIGSLVEMYVCEIENPGNIWVQYRPHAVSYNKLMRDIGIFFSTNYDDPALKIPFMSKGLVGLTVAALHGEESSVSPAYVWHRARVLKPMTLNTISVYYVDCGTEKEVALSVVRYLPKEFSKIPAQAVPAKLAGILPLNCKGTDLGSSNRWSLSSTEKLREAVERTYAVGANDGMIGHVWDRDYESGTLSLCLYDTVTNSYPSGININKLLVDEGQAVIDQSHLLDGRMTWDLDFTEARTRLEQLQVGPHFENLPRDKKSSRFVDVTPDALKLSLEKVTVWLEENEEHFKKRDGQKSGKPVP